MGHVGGVEAAAEGDDDDVVGRSGSVVVRRWSTLPPTADATGDVAAMALYAGTSAERVERVESAAAIVADLLDLDDRDRPSDTDA